MGVFRIMTERREAILNYIEDKGEISIGELAAHFGSWSEMTIIVWRQAKVRSAYA